MSEIDLNDYKSPEIKVGDQTIQVICRIDVDSLADILVSRTNEQLFHEAATLQGYVKERTCHVESVSYDELRGARYKLSCGHHVCHDGEGEPPNYCNFCGSKVVDK